MRAFKKDDIVKIDKDAASLYSVPVSRLLQIVRVEDDRIWVKHINASNTDTLYGNFEVLPATLILVEDSNS